MKFSTIVACMAVASAVKVQRMISETEENKDIEEEFSSLGQQNEQSGFKVDVKSFGNSSSPTCKGGDTATVNYTGKLTTGQVFDSSTKSGFSNPFKFTIGAQEVIPCWDQALGQMHVGEQASVTCPSNLAYGAESPGGIIPPNATLKFDIEVIDCQSGF